MTFRTITCVPLGLAAASHAHASQPIQEGPLPPADPPVAPPPRAASPAVELQLTLSDTLGISMTRIQGQELTGKAALLNFGFSAKLPRSWLGLGVGVDVGFGSVGGGNVQNDEPSVWTMEANAYLILRRLRLGVGWGRDAVEAGSKDGVPIDGVAVSGPRVFATLDLLAGSGLGLFVGVQATNPRSDYARTTLVFGLRAELPKALHLPTDPWWKPETRGRDATPSPPAE